MPVQFRPVAPRAIPRGRHCASLVPPSRDGIDTSCPESSLRDLRTSSSGCCVLWLGENAPPARFHQASGQSHPNGTGEELRFARFPTRWRVGSADCAALVRSSGEDCAALVRENCAALVFQFSSFPIQKKVRLRLSIPFQRQSFGPQANQGYKQKCLMILYEMFRGDPGGWRGDWSAI